MNIHNASFLISAVKPNQYPKTGLMEFAFAGRSNVGKSSLINKILNRKSLARVSGTPGKTVTINFYNIDDTIYLVDLPGYGYAQRSKVEIEKWGKMMEDLPSFAWRTCINFTVSICSDPSFPRFMSAT